jgi:hypothetical protein
MSTPKDENEYVPAAASEWIAPPTTVDDVACEIRRQAVLDAMRAVLECGPMRLLSATDAKLVRDELLDAAWRVLDVVPGLRARNDMHEVISAAIVYGQRPAAERRCRSGMRLNHCETHHAPLVDGKCKDSPKETS